MSAQPWCQREGLALLTDLYELTMVAGFWKEQRAGQRVCFEYFFRRLPPNAGFAVAAGLGPFLQYLENLRFSSDDLDYLATLGLFDDAFLAYLQDFRPSLTGPCRGAGVSHEHPAGGGLCAGAQLVKRRS